MARLADVPKAPNTPKRHSAIKKQLLEILFSNITMWAICIYSLAH